jgi:uncharacterized protein YjbI with pentapeptide repeats
VTTRTGPEPPRTDPVVLPELTEPQDTGDVREGERYEDLDWSGEDREFWAFTGCAFRRVDLDGTSLRGAHLAEVTLTGLEVSELVAPRSSWQRVEVTGGRIGSAELYDGSWRSVSVTGAKIGYLNARAAEWQDVRFTDCILDELDLSSARVTRLALDGCRIDTLTLSGARLTDVDLRRTDLRAVTDVAGLAGAWITPSQLSDLAPHLASHLRIGLGEPSA